MLESRTRADSGSTPANRNKKPSCPLLLINEPSARTENHPSLSLPTMMKLLKAVTLLTIAIMIASGVAEASTASKAELQALSKKEIQRLITNGQLTFVDLSTSTIRKVAPTDNHPEIFANASGTLYVLCITATDAKGKKVPIDIYVARTGSALKLVDIIYGDDARAGFMKLVKNGTVRRI